METKKRTNPETSNFFSTLTFWWMLPIFRKGYKRNLELNDLFDPLDSQRSDRKGDQLELMWYKELKKASKSNRQPSLTRVLIRLFGPVIFCFGLRIAFVEICIKMMQPLALGQLITSFSNDTESRTTRIIYSSIMVSGMIASTLIHYPTVLALLHTALKLKVSCASLIYRKALRLNQSALQQVTAGHIVNLISADLNSLDLICFLCHYFWIGPIVTIVAIVIMYQEIEHYSLCGVIIILLTVPFQGWISKVYATLKRKGSIKTDQRLELMNEIIKGIQLIKLYAWELPFTNMLSNIRKKELSLIKHSLYIKGIHSAFGVFRTRTAIFASILAYALTGNILTARKVFIVTACFNALRSTMSDNFAFAIEQAAVAKVSIKRIEKFLLQQEVEDLTLKTYKDEEKGEVKIKKSTRLKLEHVSAKWENQTEHTLNDINFEINSKGLFILIGPIGSGKSSVFNVILQELKLSSGLVQVQGCISYASQEPWLFNGTIQENILFGNQFDSDRYKKVINICCLATDFNNFQYGDQTMISDRGASLSGGQRIRINLARAIYKQADIYLLDDPFSALDLKVANDIFENCINTFLKDKICLLITHQHQYLKRAQSIILLNKGHVSAVGSYEQLTKTPNVQNEIIEDNSTSGIILTDKTPTSPKLNEEKRNTGGVTWSTYGAYFKSCGSAPYVLFVLFLFISAQISASGGDYFLKYWVSQERNLNNITTSWTDIRKNCVFNYSLIMLSTIIATILSCLAFYSTSTRSSGRLHKAMFKSIMEATMRFFQTNPTGRILNRFARDIEVADVVMPYSMINCLQTILALFGMMSIVAVVNPWLLIPTVIAALVLNLFRTIFLTVSSNLKRLESTTCSPVLSHITSSLQGLPTIRAFKAQHQLQREFDQTQDVHTSARYLNIAASRMFALWVELLCAIYLTFIMSSFITFANESEGGNVGLAITQVMSVMIIIQWGVRQSSEVANQMTSIERIIEYRDSNEKETQDSVLDVPNNWPQTGCIDFHNVTLNYNPTDPPVLKHITFSILPSEKIGIIGRTGSGKSSIINALFQLTETTGSIIIDDLNTKHVNLQTLRSKLSIIPQEPILFSGTIRKNLDPFDEYDDSILWNVLKQVNSTQLVLNEGLQTKVSENGSNFSVGQKQLLCLARAIVRNNKILILDEATANIDPETDLLIQCTVREKFKECTVLTVAHRLETITDSDKILAMENGEIKEFDHPYILLQNKNSYLNQMLQEADEVISKKFITSATNSYNKKLNS